MNKLKGWKDLLNKENDGFKYLIPNNSWIMKHEGIVKNDITPSEKVREKELHFKMQEEEYLSSNKNLDEDFKDELKWWWTTMRTPVMREWEVKDEKNKIQGLWWIR